MTQALAVKSKCLTKNEWQRAAAEHRKRAEEWTIPYRTRRASKQMHPVTDFLFIYYRNSPAHLEAWHPELGLHLEDASGDPRFSPKFYCTEGNKTWLAPEKLKPSCQHRLTMALNLCQAVQARPPQFGCFGMHEWAMVYRGKEDGEIRHSERLPLRLRQEEINALVESRPINCSHFDAFRFFTPSAKRFNRIEPSKDTRIENEQCGCLHTNMDLYKLAAQCMPWVGSELLWRCFEFAVDARRLDMRASPYDCTVLGFEPIRIETSEGRLFYEQEQRKLSETARPLRAELIRRLEDILNAPGASID